MLARQVEATPFERLLGRPLQELARGVAKELGNVHLLRLSAGDHPASAPPPGRRPAATKGLLVVEEPAEEVVKEATATTPQRGSSEERAAVSSLRRVDLAEVLDLRLLPGDYASHRDDSRPDATNVAHSRGHFLLPHSFL